jgi:hypothetical protein
VSCPSLRIKRHRDEVLLHRGGACNQERAPKRNAPLCSQVRQIKCRRYVGGLSRRCFNIPRSIPTNPSTEPLRQLHSEYSGTRNIPRYSVNGISGVWAYNPRSRATARQGRRYRAARLDRCGQSRSRRTGRPALGSASVLPRDDLVSSTIDGLAQPGGGSPKQGPGPGFSLWVPFRLNPFERQKNLASYQLR